MVSRQNTSLGLPEPVERAGAYLLLFVTGLILLATERNQNVRHHAKQSIAVSLFVFLPLFVLYILLGAIGWVLGAVPLFGGLLSFPIVLLAGIDKLVALVVWIGLMVVAGFTDRRIQAPGSRYVRRLLD